mgnify:CR=1 FL=1
MNPAAIVADLAKLAAKHPDIASMIVDVIGIALRGKNPWRAVVRKMIRVAAEKASDELADELGKLKKSWE